MKRPVIGILRILTVKCMARVGCFPGNRYTRYQGDQVTSQFDYTINPKWKFSVYNTYALTKATNGNATSARENEYVLTRDLHEWEMDLTIDSNKVKARHFMLFSVLKRLQV